MSYAPSCPKCGRRMVVLLFSAVCDYCNPVHGKAVAPENLPLPFALEQAVQATQSATPVQPTFPYGFGGMLPPVTAPAVPVFQVFPGNVTLSTQSFDGRNVLYYYVDKSKPWAIEIELAGNNVTLEKFAMATQVYPMGMVTETLSHTHWLCTKHGVGLPPEADRALMIALYDLASTQGWP